MSSQAPFLDEAFGVPASAASLDRAVEALQSNGFVVQLVDSADDARKLVGELVSPEETVFTASSETLRLSGILSDLDESGGFRSVRAAAGDLGDDLWARIRLGATPDVVVGSVHAVTEEGHVLVASASGSQFAPYASGARRVIWVVGAQKVVPDLDTAVRRARTHSLPKEWRRLHELTGSGSVLAKMLIVQQEFLPERTTIVLVREPIGF
jgi:hypothetical protein